MDHADVLTVIKFLMGESAVNEDKTEGPSLQVESIGWHVDMTTASIRPSVNSVTTFCGPYPHLGGPFRLTSHIP